MPKKRRLQLPARAKAGKKGEARAERARRIQEWAVRRWQRDQDKQKQIDKCTEWQTLAILFNELEKSKEELKGRRDRYKNKVGVQFRIDKPPARPTRAWSDLARIYHSYEDLRQEFEEEKTLYDEMFDSRFRIDKQPKMPNIPAVGLYLDDGPAPLTKDDAKELRSLLREMGTPENELPSMRQLMRIEVAVDLILSERARRKKQRKS